jgi:2-desacetyl-2-hydroxyethyl bacteriochlorophyllide A dehydrogenase
MKALMLEGPGKAAITAVSKPVRKPGEALLRVRRVGLCGSDLNSFRGRNPMVSYPRIPGHEVAATIVELDSAGSHLKVGMDVTLSPYTSCGQCASCRRGRNNACQVNQTLGVQRDGALTEYISVPLERLHPVKLDLKSLCIVEPLTVGFHAASRGRVAQGETVAVLGCGGVGLGAVAAAAFRGAITIAIDVDDAKLSTAQRAGASHGIHAQRQSIPDELRALTGGHGPDVIIEAIGTPDTFRLAVEEVAFTGRVVYIGYAKEPVAYETRLFVQKELDILGARNAQPEDFRSVIQMLEAGRFPVDAAVSTIVPLDEAPGILAQWSENPSRFTKIMIDLDASASGE